MNTNNTGDNMTNMDIEKLLETNTVDETIEQATFGAIQLALRSNKEQQLIDWFESNDTKKNAKLLDIAIQVVARHEMRQKGLNNPPYKFDSIEELQAHRSRIPLYCKERWPLLAESTIGVFFREI
jgi:hypothetical protein